MTKNTLLVELEDSLTALVLVAKELVELSTMSIDNKLITELQKKEEKLVENVQQLDEQVSKKYPGYQVEELFPKQWKVILKLLKGFQNLNEQFIQNLSVRKGLVGGEISDIRRRRADLSKLKKVYVRSPSPGSSKKGRINRSV
jgi:hypothetical protein